MEPANMRIIPHMKPALYRAAMAGTLEDYRAALPQMDEGAEDCQLAQNGNTVLHVAVLHGNRHFVKQILQEQMPHASSWRSMLYAQNNKKETVLHCAAEKGNADIVSALIKAIQDYPDLESGVTVREMIQKMDNVMDTALHKAARMGHLRVVELLIEEDNGFRYPANEAGETPIYLAAESHFFYSLKKLLETCQNFTFVGPFGRNPLHAAILSSSSGRAPSLWEKLMQIFGRHVDKVGKAESVQLLLEKEISLCEMTDNLGWTPLHYAVKFGDDETLRKILEKNRSAAYIRAGIDDDWTTIFHIAARHGNIKTMKCISNSLPDCWAMINCKSQNVLHEAILSGKGNMVKYVLKYPQIDNLIDQRDRDGNTPLHVLPLFRWSYTDYIYIVTRLKRKHLMFNKRHQTSGDVRHMATQCEVYSTYKHVSGGIPQRQRSGRRSGPRADLLQIQETNSKDTDKDRDKKINGYLRISKTMTLVATLILTISFAAGFTVPGGYDSDKGYPILLRKEEFGTFVVANSSAFMSSVLAIVVYMSMVILALGASIREDSNVRRLCLLNRLNVGATFFALISVSEAFFGGMLVTLAPFGHLANLVGVIWMSFFVFVLSLVFLHLDWRIGLCVISFISLLNFYAGGPKINFHLDAAYVTRDE